MSKIKSANNITKTNTITNNTENVTIEIKPNKLETLIEESTEDLNNIPKEDNKNTESQNSPKTSETKDELSDDAAEESTEMKANDEQIDEESLEDPPTPHATEESNDDSTE